MLDTAMTRPLLTSNATLSMRVQIPGLQTLRRVRSDRGAARARGAGRSCCYTACDEPIKGAPAPQALKLQMILTTEGLGHPQLGAEVELRLRYVNVSFRFSDPSDPPDAKPKVRAQVSPHDSDLESTEESAASQSPQRSKSRERREEESGWSR